MSAHSLSIRIGGSYWFNTEYPVFAVGDEPDFLVVIGAWFAFGALVAAGFAVCGGLRIRSGRRNLRRRRLFATRGGDP